MTTAGVTEGKFKDTYKGTGGWEEMKKEVEAEILSEKTGGGPGQGAQSRD